jgi:hypothetical protein
MPFPPQFAGMPQQFSSPGMDDGYNPMNPRMDGPMQNRGYAPGMGRYHYTPRPAIANRDEQPMGPGELPVIQDLTPKEPAADGEEKPMNGSDGVVHSGSQRMDRPQRVPRFNNHMPPRDRAPHMPPMYGGPAMHGMQGSMGMGMGMMPMEDSPALINSIITCRSVARRELSLRQFPASTDPNRSLHLAQPVPLEDARRDGKTRLW